MDLSRREVLGSSLALMAAQVATTAARAQESRLPAARLADDKSGDNATYGAAPTGLGMTVALARFLSGIRYEDLSPAAVHEAKRAVLDWTGCALAGSTHPTVTR